MKALILYFFVLTSLVQAETVTGLLTETQGKFFIDGRPLSMKGHHTPYLKSFLNYKTFVRFTGQTKNGSFVADRTPVIVSAPSKLQGILTVSGSSVYINQTKVEFIEALKVNGYSFNSASVRFFDNKEVIVNGTYEKDLFRVSAIVPAYLYSGNMVENAYRPKNVHAEFDENPYQYVLNLLPQNEYSRTQQSFRGTVIGEDEKVKKGDHALVITLSGRQGDDLNAANGHFAIGMARVNDDLTLDMEIQNYYPPKNEKQIIPGFIDYVDYFGGITAGQNNYRPTYTMIIYGESRETLLEMRDSLDEEFADLRNGADNFSMGHNCTTVSVDALKGIGIFGKSGRFWNKIANPKNLMKINPFYFIGPNLETLIGQLSYSFAMTSTYNVPRPAFDSILKNLWWLMGTGRLEGYRVDYIFQAQTPSDRPVGGTAADGFMESLKVKLQWKKGLKEKFSRSEILRVLNKVD